VTVDGETEATARFSWEAKRKLAARVSNAKVDGEVAPALDAGEAGGKLTGADGGGFLLVACSPEHQRSVRESLNGMRELPVKLDRLGSHRAHMQHDIWC
jgi:D-glycero-alpha-D-manno-heptose-7-phosphate kinase